MKKFIIIIIIICVPYIINAGEIAYGEIKNVSQYNQLQELKTKPIKPLKNQSQPAAMFGYQHYFKSDIIMFWGQKQILMNIDIIMSGYHAGKIELIGIRTYNKKGDITDSDLRTINNRIRELENYEVEIST